MVMIGRIYTPIMLLGQAVMLPLLLLTGLFSAWIYVLFTSVFGEWVTGYHLLLLGLRWLAALAVLADFVTVVAFPSPPGFCGCCHPLHLSRF